MRTQDQRLLASRARIVNSAAECILKDAQTVGSLSVIPLRWYQPSDVLASEISAFNFESDSDEEDYFRSLPHESALAELSAMTDSMLLTSAQIERVTRRPQRHRTIRDEWIPLVQAVELLERARYQSEVILRNPRQDYAPLPPGATVMPTIYAPRRPARSRAQAPQERDLSSLFDDALQLPLPET